MKRSEIVKTIKDFFYNNDFYNFDDEHADLLLSKLESQGMLPPPYTFKQKVVNNPTGNTISVTNYEWEDEE